MKAMRNRLFPHPLLSLSIVAIWLLLVNEFSMGHLVLGAVIGVAVPLLTAAYWPDRPRVRNVPAILAYGAFVLVDILVSNVQVAWIVLFRSNASLRSHFIEIPLELRSPEAIAVLAGTITMTPGTVSADLSSDGRSLLVHCLDAADPDDVVASIKSRYERRLKEIFE